MKRALLLLVVFSAIFSACTRDYGDMYDPEFVREYYESQWKKQFGEIDPNQTWNVAQSVSANLSIKEDALTDYTFNIYTSNPLYDKDAKLMAKTKVTTDADGYATTNIKFDAPNGLKYFYVMRVEENGRRAIKAIQAANGVLNASFGDVESQGARALVDSGDLESTKMACPYTVEEVNQMIATGKKFSDYPGYVDDFWAGGVFVITGTEESQNRFSIWCNNKTTLVIADGGVLNLNTTGSWGNLEIVVADGGTLNLITGNHVLNGPVSKLIVMEGGLVEDKSNSNVSSSTTLTHSYIVVESKDQVQEDWDTQFWIMLDSNQPFQEGQQWEVSMKVKADIAATAQTQTHREPGDCVIWYGIGDVNFTTDWQTYTASGTIQADQVGGYSIAFNLNVFDAANKYYFDDISFKLNGQELVVNGDCSDLNNKTSFKTKIDRGTPADSHFETWQETISNNNGSPQYSLDLGNALLYNAGTMKNINRISTNSSSTIYIAETGVYTGTEIYIGQPTDIITNWGRVDLVRLIGANKQGTLTNGCLFRSSERVEVLCLNMNGYTALECELIRVNEVSLRENSILRANRFEVGDGQGGLYYRGKSESASLVSAKTMHSAAGSIKVEGKIYIEFDNYEYRAEENFINANPMYGISKVGEANFAIFPSIDTSLEKSECTGQGNLPDDYVPPTPENGQVWIVACEDLGSIGDYDFNDIVFSVTYVPGGENDTVVVQALAAGGTIPANVYVNNELIGEIHGLFGISDTGKMINTLEEDLASGHIYNGMVKKIVAPGFSISTADMGKIRIDILNGDGQVKTAVGPSQGSAPQMICVPSPWNWPVEYVSIGAAYPLFGAWGAGYNEGTNWYNTTVVKENTFAK